MVFEHMFSSLRQQHWELTVESNESKKSNSGCESRTCVSASTGSGYSMIVLAVESSVVQRVFRVVVIDREDYV
ncbi:MAG: hypothetical protein J07HQW2_01747 [Haloquadratum walsbyi J07HQW2]|uniref:Uncharacterized protein n=1 Tax=Haloquadratum walsbyi J07HQW2 TaxID=1238425 RepID=U1MXT6_9EURY|nr:MAG: hypothetical protein J07HQW2_01747 [Haloquadratum walsbyi J07HQW2]